MQLINCGSVFADQCGQCGGNNDTCVFITKSFNESAREAGYRMVAKIKAGSSNLDIRQYSANGLRDDNYLGNDSAIREGATIILILGSKIRKLCSQHSDPNSAPDQFISS